MTKYYVIDKVHYVYYNNNLIMHITEDTVYLHQENYDKGDSSFCNLVSFFTESIVAVNSKVTIDGDDYVLNSLTGNSKITFETAKENTTQVYRARFKR